MSSSKTRSMAKNVALTTMPPLRRLVEQRDAARKKSVRWERKSLALQERIDAMQGEVAALSLGSGESPADLDLDYVFIVAYGRSGSTLLQGVLDSIPGYDVKGENNDALHHLFLYHQQLVANRAKLSAKRLLDSRHPWYGADQYAAEAALTFMRALVVKTVLQPQPGTRVTGFKEIRWQHNDWEEYLTFLQQLFPRARFVINTRNHAEVAKSRWWAERKNPMKRLARFERQFDDIAAFLGDQAYRVHFDDYVADHGVLRGLFDWLGEDFDPETIERVMNTKHSIGEGPEHLRKDKS